MSSDDKSTAIDLDQKAVHTSIHNNNVWLLHVAEVQLLHKATLQDLLHTQNYTIEHLLHEWNELLWEP
jgi:hypothetical protein